MTLPSKRSKPAITTVAAASAAVSGGDPDDEAEEPILPGLPDHLAHLCLSSIPPSLLYSVCRRWRRLIYSPSFPPFLSLYALLSAAGGGNDDDPAVELSCYDPISGEWSPLPSPPPHRRLLLRHPSFIARALPVQSVAAAGHLVLLAATTHRLLPALPRPLAFDPIARRWRLGPSLPSPRRWCAAGAAGDCVYVASGVGPEYSAAVARSADRWDPRAAAWERVAPLRDGRFCRDAVAAVGAEGRLCVVNVAGREGAVYDVGADRWGEMPAGMLAGWSGPAAADEGVIYTVDEAAGTLRGYEWGRDRWRAVAASGRLKEVAAVAAGGRRVCVACGGGEAVVVFDVAAAAAAAERRTWVVEPPAGKRVLALHVLPRMSCHDT